MLAEVSVPIMFAVQGPAMSLLGQRDAGAGAVGKLLQCSGWLCPGGAGPANQSVLNCESALCIEREGRSWS